MTTNLDDAGLSLFLKGPSGSGKTEGLLSMPGPIHLTYTDVNLATVKAKRKQRGDIMFEPCGCWSDYEDIYIPKVLNRQIEAATLGLDTLDFLCDMMWQSIQGSKARLSMSDFGEGLSKLVQTTKTLASSTLPKGNHPGYNVVVTSHLKDISDDSGGLLKVQPAIMGAFKDKVEDFFDHVYLCKAEVNTKIVDSKAIKERQFRLFTVDPDRYNTCKAPATMPPEIVIPVGKGLFEVCNEYWNLNG